MSELVATVVRATRRWVTLRTSSGDTLEARSASKAVDLTVGDRVRVVRETQDYVVEEQLPRMNTLQRRSQNRSKVFAANVDHLLIVSAPGALFNRDFIDRALVVAEEQEVPATIVINKCDLIGSDGTPWSIYREIGYTVLEVSVKFEINLTAILESIRDDSVDWIVLCGLSGVGKSTLLNWLIPGTKQRTNEVSGIGQGKQTTTQPEAFEYLIESHNAKYLVDLPGFSQFGIDHIDPKKLADYFPEIRQHATRCPFDNCSHIKEEVCAVKEALNEGRVQANRYQSYCQLREELENAQPY